MKIIDFEKKGNVVRFWLGEDDCNDYWGDDFDDAPYDCNAGTVYVRYRKGYKDISFPFDWDVCEPADGDFNTRWSKQDMIKGLVPCIVAAPCDEDRWCDDSFKSVLPRKNCIKYYFNDKLEPDYLISYDENYKCTKTKVANYLKREEYNFEFLS